MLNLNEKISMCLQSLAVVQKTAFTSENLSIIIIIIIVIIVMLIMATMFSNKK